MKRPGWVEADNSIVENALRDVTLGAENGLCEAGKRTADADGVWRPEIRTPSTKVN
ncbi:hypothetical protein ACHHY8_01825 [Enterobacter cloacae complex sp. 2024EL-00215]|jgi:hypothetical protein|uniref:hypothetical protein n=1 Tax=Enterobacter TaxID=547 RepID=UPI0015F529F1|nr:hypothetical protein [Enterobacter sp. RHBSTW-00901]MBA7856925.1 hypothetical protein [Enterobacter sp. RHBSTW-00901]